MLDGTAAPVDSVMFIIRRHLHSDSICFPDADRMDVKTPTLSETTLLANEEKAFALEPVSITRRHNDCVPSTRKCSIYHADIH